MPRPWPLPWPVKSTLALAQAAAGAAVLTSPANEAAVTAPATSAARRRAELLGREELMRRPNVRRTSARTDRTRYSKRWQCQSQNGRCNTLFDLGTDLLSVPAVAVIQPTARLVAGAVADRVAAVAVPVSDQRQVSGHSEVAGVVHERVTGRVHPPEHPAEVFAVAVPAVPIEVAGEHRGAADAELIASPRRAGGQRVDQVDVVVHGIPDADRAAVVAVPVTGQRLEVPAAEQHLDQRRARRPAHAVDQAEPGGAGVVYADRVDPVAVPVAAHRDVAGGAQPDRVVRRARHQRIAEVEGAGPSPVHPDGVLAVPVEVAAEWLVSGL